MKNKLVKKLSDVDDIDKLFKDHGMTSVVKCVLPLIIDKHEIPKDLLVELSDSLTLRNTIIHRSQYNVPEEKARKAVSAIRRALDILDPRYLTSKKEK